MADVLALVHQLLDAGKASEAVELLRQSGKGSPELSNAYGVSLMRAGEITKAIDVYRSLCLSENGVCLKTDLPTRYKANFATALLLAKNVSGCLSILGEVDDEGDPGVLRLRAAITRWSQSLSRWRRFWFKVFGEAPEGVVPLDFEPGELSDPSRLRPAA
jgi:hypothetical protein